MNPDHPPRLGPSSVLAVVREGGFAAMPGLEKPRQIDCRELNEQQRARLQGILDEVERQHSLPASPGADRRIFKLILEAPESGPCWQRELDETATPSVLIGLWKHGPQALDE
ncbi:protealysin inhibitor emfourin [Salinicola peritrichatus]|uniref:protealysin inhibitor emfourin n=1 Tax=Salinicola peritrichatus TaxID=1267424 RepID=UPI000DA2492D|nr:protealysin inhibitor emfourin [Salinicola peritrichatus]